MMKPVLAAVTGAVISGALMFTVGATQRVPETPQFVQTVDGGFVPVSQVTYPMSLRAPEPVATSAPRATATRTVYRTATPAPRATRTVVRDEPRAIVREEVSTVATQEEVSSPDERSWKKTAMIIGGSAASGAGVGGIVKGKKGALIGAAIGGGAASIYEATRRR
jgi:hypothetical protein